ncbi:hypothetical protein ACWEQG_01540 [Microbispora sp. NPDC004025]
MNPRITQLRAALQHDALGIHDVAETYQGPGEEGFTEEFTVVFDDGTELHVQIQEGACPAK